MKISVAIPARNEGAALRLTLKYFTEQRRRHDLEIIVVDDASDRPLSGLPAGIVCARHETRQGIARARNTAAELATGDVLIHVDGHVFLSENALDAICEACDDRSQISVRTQLMYDFAQFERRQTESLRAPHFFGWRWRFEPEVAVVPNFKASERTPHDVPFAGAACLAMSRRLFETLGGFDDGLVGAGNFEDCDLAFTAWACGYRVRMLPAVTCYHYSAPEPHWNRKGRSPLDEPRYDGSLQNALRVLERHLPEARFHDALASIARRTPLSWSNLPASCLARLAAGGSDRPEWEARRVHSRDWVARKMQGEQ